MQRFALIGHQIAHSLSPKIFAAAYSARYPYDLIDEENFEAAWTRFLQGYDAINVTAPFKELAYQRADIIAPDAKRVGATNICVKTPDGIVAHNSDYLGLKAILASLISKLSAPDSCAIRTSLTNELRGTNSGSIVTSNCHCSSPSTAIAAKAPQASAAVIGFGGAGKAALAAAEDTGLDTRLYRHAEIANGVAADIIIYTLPRWVDGADKLSCRFLIEANYKDPILSKHEGYISGNEWLKWQAITGYALMTGEAPKL